MEKPSRRRWFRFGLRSLLLLVTAIGIALGWTISNIRHQQRLLAELEGLDGVIVFIHQDESLDAPAPGPAWLKRLLGDDFWVEVRAVKIGSLTSPPTSVSPETIQRLKGLRKLDHLQLVGTNVDDTCLAEMAELTSLRMLALYRTSITDAGLRCLESATWLEEIYLWDSQTTFAGRERLRNALPNCAIDGQ